jgi:hypothetical protein
VLGANAVGHNRSGGVAAAVLGSVVEDIVCAAKELTGASVSGAALAAGHELVSTLTSTASTLLSGTDLLAVAAADSRLAFGVFVGAAVSSSFFDPELVCAPPVLTTTLDGACDVVDPVEVDASSVSEPFGCSVPVATFSTSV